MGWPGSNAQKISSSSLSWPLHLISLGLGGYNPSLQAFAAEQLEDEDELPSTKDDKSSTKKSLFFQWWYFGICCGSLLGVSVMSYIQDTIGWGIGFAIPTIAMVASIAIFLSANKFYVRNSSKEMSLEKMIQAIKNTLSRLKNHGEIPLQSNKSDAVHELE